MPEKSEIISRVINLSNHFTELEGRRVRLLIASLNGNKYNVINQVSSELADLGFDIDIAPNCNSLDQIAQQAADNDVHGILLLTDVELKENSMSKVNKSLNDLSCNDVIVAIKIKNDINLTKADLPDNIIIYNQEAHVVKIALDILNLFMK